MPLGPGRPDAARDARAELLARAGRLLLECNESTGAIHRTLAATARALADERCTVVVSYDGVAVSLGRASPTIEPSRPIRSDTALLADVHAALVRVRRGNLDPEAALDRLEHAAGEVEAPRHPVWLSVLLTGLAAASLAVLLHADAGAAVAAGLSSALGLAARRLLDRRGVSLLVPPCMAAGLGAVAGGLAFRLGWTRRPGLAVVVPSLMLVPGPHLINGLLDLIDNHLPMGLARLGLAAGLLLASAAGIVLGMELTALGPSAEGPALGTGHLNVASDMALAGVVTCGFAISFNSRWTQIARAALGGMVGHGLRFLALGAGSSLGAATFLGAFTIGAGAALLVRPKGTPVAVIAFAGGVTMMPGMQIYRALGGALQLARLGPASGATSIAAAIGNAAQAGIVVGAIALGLVIGARASRIILRYLPDRGGEASQSD